MADAFFQDKQEETPVEVPEVPTTVKVGEKEYSQEDLNKLVGLGEVASELESKWNTKIDKLYPDYTKKSQELADLRKQQEIDAQAKVQQKVDMGQELSPEDRKAMIIKEAEQYGLVHAGNINKFIADFEAGRELLGDIDKINAEAKETGKPVTTREELLSFMEENGVRNPEFAYKMKFEKEIDAWKEQQKNSLKGPAFETGTGGASAKVPVDVKVTRENLQQLVHDTLAGEG